MIHGNTKIVQSVFTPGKHIPDLEVPMNFFFIPTFPCVRPVHTHCPDYRQTYSSIPKLYMKGALPLVRWPVTRPQELVNCGKI